MIESRSWRRTARPSSGRRARSESVSSRQQQHLFGPDCMLCPAFLSAVLDPRSLRPTVCRLSPLRKVTSPREWDFCELIDEEPFRGVGRRCSLGGSVEQQASKQRQVFETLPGYETDWRAHGFHHSTGAATGQLGGLWWVGGRCVRARVGRDGVPGDMGPPSHTPPRTLLVRKEDPVHVPRGWSAP